MESKDPKELIIDLNTQFESWVELGSALADLKSKYPDGKVTLPVFIDLCRKGYTNNTIKNIDIVGYDLSYMNFSNIRFDNVKFYNSNMGNTLFRKSTFTNCIFNNVSLLGATFSESLGHHIEFIDSNMSCTIVSSTNFVDITFSNVELMNAIIVDSSLCINHITKCSNALNMKVLDSELVTYVPGKNYDNRNIGLDRFKGANIPSYSCPETGSFTGWKITIDKVADTTTMKDRIEYEKIYNGFPSIKLVKLTIPARAERSSGLGKKCRCSKAKVEAVYDLVYNKKGRPNNISSYNIKRSKLTTTYSCFPSKPIVYKVGKTVIADKYDMDRWQTCSNGIHFFMNKSDALQFAMKSYYSPCANNMPEPFHSAAIDHAQKVYKTLCT